MLELVNKEDCSSIENCGTRKSDRKKLEAKKKERSITKEIIMTRRGHKYRYLIYWDKKRNVPRNICIGKVDI